MSSRQKRDHLFLICRDGVSCRGDTLLEIHDNSLVDATIHPILQDPLPRVCPVMRRPGAVYTMRHKGATISGSAIIKALKVVSSVMFETYIINFICKRSQMYHACGHCT